MIAFLLLTVLITLLFAGLILTIKRHVVTGYRGGILIVMSCLYFSALFVLAHFMREGFK